MTEKQRCCGSAPRTVNLDRKALKARLLTMMILSNGVICMKVLDKKCTEEVSAMEFGYFKSILHD